MSQTISVGVVGPSHWIYMATVMADCLDEIARIGRVPPNAVPVRVRQDALRFSNLALQATTASVPDNPPASLNAYVIASDVLRQSSHELEPTREKINSQLSQYETFLQQLTTPRELDENERHLVVSLCTFFKHLKEEGESCFGSA